MGRLRQRRSPIMKRLALITLAPLNGYGFSPGQYKPCTSHILKPSRPSIFRPQQWNSIHQMALPTQNIIKPMEGTTICNKFHFLSQSESSTSLRLKATSILLDGEEPKSEVNKPSFPLVIWRFTRPHTLIGSAVAIPAIHLLAAPTFSSVLSAPMFISLMYSMIPALLMNLYITGLNQITDVEIDKINKPDLPIAKGDLSTTTAIVVVIISLLASLIMGSFHPVYGTSGLNFALWGSAILGTMYSLPPFRLKRFPFFAAFCIVAVRGTIVNAGFYAHALAAAFNQSTATIWNTILTDKKCFLSSLFFGVFGIVIALMKDVPDVKGDKLSNIRSFSVRIGQKQIFQSMRRLVSLLFYLFGAGFIQGSYLAFQNSNFLHSFSRGAIALFAFLFGVRARNMGKLVDAEDSDEVYKYYMSLWKLFYASYLALPFAK